VLERVAYLNAGTFGPLPRSTIEAIRTRLASDLETGRSGQEYWERTAELRDRLRAAFARLLNSSPDTIVLTTSTTEGCNIVISGLDLGPEDEVVTTNCEHPGLFGALKTSGARLRLAAVREARADEALAALEAEVSPRTRLIAVSHVAWTTGNLLPVAELAERGIPVLVDGAQAAGTLPVDVEALGCDFYTVSAQKWLLGPDATGCLYMRPERADDLRLAFPSYFSWDYPEYEPKAGVSRFDPGWIPLASLEGVLASFAFAEEVGDERFEAARAMTARCRDLVAERAQLVTAPDQATLVTWVADGEPEEIVRLLAEQGVVVRDLPRTGWVRASCGFWTSEGDLERLVRGRI
jgi:L-cysteine/cystine lyase